MKRKAEVWAVLMTLTAANAWAVDTTQVYSSGLLVLLFVGLCALVVLAQMVPAAMLLSGMISQVAKLFSEQKTAKAAEHK